MSPVRVGMTLLLLGGVAACGTSTGSATQPTASSTASPRTTTAAPAKKPQTQTNSPSTSKIPPPYIARVIWVTLPSGRSLQIYPTANGRIADAAGAEDEAWREVLRKAPNAGTAGMRAQFDCHWQLARLAAPKKPSWNLEPWRPVVSAQRMYDTRCNPGGPEV